MSATTRHEIASLQFRQLEANPCAVTSAELAWEMAAEEILEKYIGVWLESASNEREPSVYWTSISSEELMFIVFGNKATSEQRDQAVITLRRRFFVEHSDLIADLETSMSIGAGQGYVRES